MRKADAGSTAPEAHTTVAGAASSAGKPLPAPLQGKLEQKLGGRDLSAVRLHTGPNSAAAAGAIAAKAYAQGNDIHFATGQYDPTSEAGQHLLAHEVAHTVQQQGISQPIHQRAVNAGAELSINQVQFSQPGDTHEQQADAFADAFVSGSDNDVGVTSGSVPPRQVNRKKRDGAAAGKTAVSALPATVEFAPTRVGQRSRPASVTLVNDGADVVTVAKIVELITNAVPPELGVYGLTSAGLTIPSTGGHVTLELYFEPRSAGAYENTLTPLDVNQQRLCVFSVRGRAPATGHQAPPPTARVKSTPNPPSAPATGAMSESKTPIPKRSTQPAISVSTSHINFGRVRPGFEPTRVVTIRNHGEAAITIDNIADASGSIPPEITVTRFAQNTNLEPGESIDVTIGYTPTSDDATSCMLYVTTGSDASSAFIAIDGIPAPNTSPASGTGPVVLRTDPDRPHSQLGRAAAALAQIKQQLGLFSKAVDDLNGAPLSSIAAQVVKHWTVAKTLHDKVLAGALLDGDATMMRSGEAMRRRFEVIRSSIERTIGPNQFEGKSALGYIKPITGDVATYVTAETAKLQKTVRLLKRMRKAWFLEQTSNQGPARAEVVGDLQKLQNSDFEHWRFARYVMVSGNYWSHYKGVKGPGGRTLEGSALQHGSSFGDLMEGVGDELGNVVKELPGTAINTVDPRNVWHDFRGYTRELVHGHKHKPRWPINQGFDPLVRQPKKSAKAIGNALESAIKAIANGDTHQLGVAIVMIGSVLAPGVGEAKLADSLEKLARIEKHILKRLENPMRGEKTHLQTQLRRVRAFIRRGKKLQKKAGKHVPTKHLEPDAWTRLDGYHPPSPAKSVDDIRETLNTDSKMVHPMPDGLPREERIAVYKKRTKYFDTIEQQARVEQKRLSEKLKQATAGSDEHARLRSELDGAKRLEQAAKVKPLAGRLSSRKSAQLTRDALAYVHDVETQTGLKLHPKQIKRLAQELRERLHIKLPSPMAVAKHRAKFTHKKKNQLIKQWEANTGQKWPRYTEVVYDKDGGIARSIGDYYDAHHIIENKFGGKHEWWNIHPARFPDQHQGGIHREGGPTSRIFDSD